MRAIDTATGATICSVSNESGAENALNEGKVESPPLKDAAPNDSARVGAGRARS